MFCYLVFFAVLLHVTCVGSNRCPTLEHIRPCKCEDNGRFGLEVICNDGMVDGIRDALANVANTKLPIVKMTLQDVLLPNLPPNLLLGHNVHWLTIENCSTSSVNEDAFVHMESALKILYLTHNALERVPSQALKNLVNLKELKLSSNSIEVLHAEAFMGLDSLLYLSLLDNRIKFIDNSAFVGIGKRFTKLYLGGNQLTDVPCLQLRNQSSLQLLHVQNNKITSLLPKEFDAMGGESLKYLDLTNNAIRHLPASVFSSLKSLFYLDLSRNGIESISPSAFEGTQDTLQYLRLGDNRLEEVPSAALKNMRVLKSFYLFNNKICKIRKYEFLTYGKSINTISLRNNTLKYIDASAFTGLDSLTDLWLESNQLKTLSFETIRPVSDTLQRFGIRDNPLHCDCNLGWMKEQKPRIFDYPLFIKCATPIEYANVSLKDIPPDQLVCNDNEKSNPTEPCCNCFINSQQPATSNDLMSIFPIIFSYLLP